MYLFKFRQKNVALKKQSMIIFLLCHSTYVKTFIYLQLTINKSYIYGTKCLKSNSALKFKIKMRYRVKQ